MPADHGQHMKHGSETFYIEGEGLLVTQLGGRTGDEPDPLDASGSMRAPAARALAPREAVPFRFSRVGPKGTPLDARITKKLARGGHTLKATYSGGFVARTSVSASFTIKVK